LRLIGDECLILVRCWNRSRDAAARRILSPSQRSMGARMTVNLKQLVAQTCALLIAFALALFIPAGTLRWRPGWVFLGLFGAFVNGISLWLLRHNPALLRERMTGFTPDQKPWDKALLALTGVTFFAWLVAMPLDAVRFRWSRMPAGLRAVGAAVLLGSFALFFLAFRENAYLSPVVRIQGERGQVVVATGPYRHVRHPMYAGFLLFVLGTALLLGSRLGLLGGLALGGLVARRAVLEERALRAGLPGYGAYLGRVRFRLIPRVW
jgi:protein-S-isoprenylcysteine O-methyltransferase Ste14